MTTSKYDAIAFDVAQRVMSPDDVRAYGIDPSLILVIVKILTELAPIIANCIDDSEDPVAALKRFVEYKGLGWRWRQMKLRQTVRRNMRKEYGRGVPSGFIVDVEREILRAATIPEYAQTFMSVA